ncbi:MAG: TIGR03618 family F420-dependent PPOX class oxidoreductase [Nitrososphaeraceae archaeon]|nr:TIGR03618 family F420-dependent PPOX class oxidoreductase [Nitrososphaeraceae archaeon]
MSKNETKKFLMQGTFTAKLTTVNKDGGPHVVPVWFVLDERKNRTARKIEDIVFTTYGDSLKATNIQRDNRVSICVDDQTPQFSFVTIHGTAKIVRQKYNELLKWNTRIAERYMGKSNAKAYGKRNTTEGVILVRVKPTKIIAEKDIAAWE